MTVTKMTASASPASDGSDDHGKLRNGANFHGSFRPAAGCSPNSQPLSCAAAIVVPVISSTRCVASSAVSSTPGMMSGLLKRRSST